MLLVALLSAAVLAACGSASSGSGSAQTLLKQTFSGSHTVKSGVLTFDLSLTPDRARARSGPGLVGSERSVPESWRG